MLFESGEFSSQLSYLDGLRPDQRRRVVTRTFSGVAQIRYLLYPSQRQPGGLSCKGEGLSCSPGDISSPRRGTRAVSWQSRVQSSHSSASGSLRLIGPADPKSLIWQDLAMADERGLEGLDPYDLQDVEATRIGDWVMQLDEAGLATPSACEGWSRRDVLAHLLANEEYHRACLSGSVRELFERLMSTGATSLDEFNATGVALYANTPTGEMLAAWRSQSAENRAGFRAADGTDIDSSVGSYPARAQAFHVAYELAVHADDMGAPVGADESEHRQRWLAGVSRFALTEVKDDVSVELSDDGFVVRQGDREATFDRPSFVAGVSGRAGPNPLGEADAELLSLGY